MNLKVQNYPQYNLINTTLPKYSNPNFGSKHNVRYLHNEVETSKVRLKFSDTLTKLSLWVFRMAEKVSKKGKIDTQNQSFEKEKIIRTLTKELNLANGKIEQIINAHENEEINPVKRERIYEEIKNSELNYNPMLPYIEMSKPMYALEKYKYKYEDIKTGTSNRADMKPLVIPEITRNGFYFELPKGEMKIKKVKLKELKEPFELQSNISDKYKNTTAEAIIDSDTHSCKGFYIDREYINKNNFGKVLETTLHELSHKAGGDGSKDFGYKLTSVNGNVFDQIFNEHKVAEELRILNNIWNNL